ncbi:transposase family protein [Streptomyces sp. NPDC058572]|uniref:transposase family protein n=1 Tax=Streptomyces sp. NPDC058572 TaxID=3346546 RepID=UPI003664FFC5
MAPVRLPRGPRRTGGHGRSGLHRLRPAHTETQTPGRERSAGDKVANRAINTLRAAVERAIAHLKDWKIFATRYRGPLTRSVLVAKTATALAFYKKGR